MLQQGVHSKVVQERLGHADSTLTLGTYSHVLPDIQEQAMQKLDRVLSARGRASASAKADLGSDFERDYFQKTP